MNSMISTSEQGTPLATILGEFATKLSALNDRVLEHWADKDSGGIWERHAILLDRIEMIRKPLEVVIGGASQLLEHGDLEPFQRGELTLRLAEVETELHHAIRHTEQLKANLARDPQFQITVARLRMTAGINGMKGGPLRPKS